LHLFPEANNLILTNSQASLYGLRRAHDGGEIDPSPINSMEYDMEGWRYPAVEVDTRIRRLYEERKGVPNRPNSEIQLLDERGAVRERDWVLQRDKEVDSSSLIAGEPWPRVSDRAHYASVPLHSRCVAIAHRSCRHV
jgi:hypothetical protein